ncbi:uncharacterized protein PADG_01749 [Paracoccidioides brasiliensis Pb18]|uniref:Uncharacterized protein n=1 Tax=Paracoccidioides brasiliensis (strain Pb18) TaxID=502780 RepID=C1G483_PARBD|nr:uncharacterized protein PADG_01749 [Paracoccidioides brasiliensis Pb18]EEH45599.2 hypothetical protein PADG_01749 [Paracoccidioides brasiliensis Pb18]
MTVPLGMAKGVEKQLLGMGPIPAITGELVKPKQFWPPEKQLR